MCNLTFDFKGNKKELIDKLRDKILKANGKFNGDYNSGECSGDKPAKYKFTYEFTELSSKLLIEIKKKPFFISCDLIEESIQEYLNTSNIEAFDKLLESLSESRQQ